MARNHMQADGIFDVLNLFVLPRALKDFSPLDLVIIYFTTSLSSFNQKSYLTFNLYSAACLAPAS